MLRKTFSMVLMKSYDVIFIHPSRVVNENAPPSRAKRSSFMFMPMGLLAIADLCEKEGFSTQIINYPMERYYNPTFSLTNFLKDIDFKVAGIDLHWFFHAHGATETAKIVKRVNPNAKVIFGGFTATYFHEEILKYYKMVDGIIRGEGEVPFLKYVQQVARNRSVDEIPNLSYRDTSQHIKINPITYVAPSLDNLNFTNFSLVNNGRKYVESSRQMMYMYFNLAIGRGCPFNCPYCGGGREAQLLLTKREKVILRHPEKVIGDLHEIFDKYDAKGVFFGHGTYPENLKYWKTLFQLIRKEKFDLSADLEIWRLPFPKEMWYLFCKTFRRYRTSLSIGPQTMSTRVQRKIAELCDPTFSYPMNQINDEIKNANLFRIPLRIWITIGLPFQTRADLLRDYLFSLSLNLKYGKSTNQPISIMNDLVAISPASPVYEHPERWGVKLHFKTFRQLADVVKKTTNALGPWNNIINYDTNHFSSAMNRAWNLLFLVSNIPLFLTSGSKEDIAQKESK